MTEIKKTPRERLIEQKEKLDAKIKQLDAREKEKQRKLETRRKIILGGMVQTHMEIDENFKQLIEPLMKRLISRDNDRALFDLPPLEEGKTSPQEKMESD